MKKINSIIYLVGELTIAASQWYMISMISKNYSLDYLGMFTYFLAVIAPITVIIQMQHRTIYVTQGILNYTIGHFIKIRMQLLIFSAITIFLLSFFIEIKNLQIFFLIFFWKAFELMSDLVYAYWQKNNQINKISLSKIVRSILYIVTFVIFIYLEKSLAYILIFIVIIAIIIFFWDLFKSSLNIINIIFNTVLKYNDIKKIIFMSLPLAIASMLNIIYINIPKYILAEFSMTEEIAIFSSISYILILGNMIINSIIQVKINYISELYNVKKFKELKKDINIFFFLIITISIIAIFITYIIGEDMLKAIYNEKISKHNFLLILLIVGSVFNYFSIVIGVVLTAAKKYAVQPVLSFFWCLIYIIFSIVCIKNYGLYGVGYSYICSSIIQFASIYYFYNTLVRGKI
ncbi:MULTISPECIES: lipopolysaccharide biosynthesis protein [unclassified Exiguobacterium]|uniref:lipopolysaccharide biosynthesis protein n=1 Tax=unclassified Exiguobacterium TaxID=2644629 RepID=UPI001BE97176|nr:MULTISPECIES: hypothetical protein [unclassified Exiguobacterium]